MADKEIYDIDFQGTIDNSGAITPLYGEDAVKNSIVLWLTSFKNDCIRNNGHGGYVTQFLFKPMSEDNIDNIKQSIIDGLNNDYTPTVSLKSISVIPDYEKNQWLIDLIVYIDALKETVPVTTVINNLV